MLISSMRNLAFAVLLASAASTALGGPVPHRGAPSSRSASARSGSSP